MMFAPLSHVGAVVSLVAAAHPNSTLDTVSLVMTTILLSEVLLTEFPAIAPFVGIPVPVIVLVDPGVPLLVAGMPPMYRPYTPAAVVVLPGALRVASVLVPAAADTVTGVRAESAVFDIYPVCVAVTLTK